ncbi:extracellular solute-binding protein [Mumia sp. zg.B17]|uniref:extracellular solute-binding protein n=1 Tax=unclassified Mumia TaxID=2621872 RepID=UPI001C6E0369|nr:MULTISPECIES: extracellular solute-binding protein [unclassified Mumia]MBW9206865.1 extracellular solute-binding protein [Mumia sp. zg.B17]MDD9349918.1 extracellular solute-binding protein [Mumia sp.]
MRMRARRRAAVLAATVITAGALAACGGGGSDSGTPTLTWYINPDVSNLDPYVTGEDGKQTPGGQAYLAMKCAKESNGAYDIKVQLLPNDASQQREQLVRRLAAKDTSIDLMSLDPAFTAEFANAGFLEPMSEEQQSQLSEGMLDGAIEAATYDDNLVAVPLWSNTQILWYKKSVAKKAGLDTSGPVTWDQVIAAAEKTGTTVSVQAKRYEGYSVWINSLVAGAGGQIVEDPEAGKDAKITIDSPAGKAAAEVVSTLGKSDAAPPALSNADEGGSVAAFSAADGGFLVNWTYLYSDPNVAPFKEDLAWVRYPRTVADEESRPPIGGINIGVSSYGKHPELAYEATACLTSEESQKTYAQASGNQPARSAIYDEPETRKAFPMAPLWRESIDAAAARPMTPYWSDISTALYSSWHPPSSVNPDKTPAESKRYIEDVLQGKALL